MSRRNTLVITVLALIFVFAVCALIYPLFGRKQMRLGLDLVGGIHLVYQAQFPTDATAADKTKDMERAIQTIQRRIDKYGVTEPIIQQQGEDRIVVELPGFTDIEEAKRLVEQTGFLEFREVELNDNGEPVYLSDYLTSTDFFDKNETGNRIFVNDKNNPVAFLSKDEQGNLKFTDEQGNPIDPETLKQGSTNLLSWIAARGDDGTQLTGNLLKTATANIATQATGAAPEVDIEWNDQGSVIFDQVASRLYNSGDYGTPQRALGIFLDNSLISDPQIMESSYQGKASITGTFTIDEVTLLANLLESGSLPMPLQKPPLYEEQVSATLGANFVDMSLKAGIIGIIVVMLFMIAYYRLPGAMASLALFFYGALVLALFKMIPVTLNLAGIGGFVLSIGMAVDANVLIFERMKEELRSGRTLASAIEVGFNRAWSAIRDSNVTTFIACGILYWLGSSVVASAPVMGFALTLFIGVAVSMISAIVVTRTLMRPLAGARWARKAALFIAYSGEKHA
jgi:protein-export membrane protein SecD